MKSETAEWYIEFGPVQPPPGPGDGSDASIYSEIFRGTEEEAKQRGEFLCEEYRKNYPTKKWVGCGYLERTGDEEYPLYDPDIGRFDVGYSIRKREPKPKITKPYFLIWEDWQDEQSHGMAIDVPEGEDPEVFAHQFLSNYGELDKFGFLIESVKEIKEGEKVSRF